MIEIVEAPKISNGAMAFLNQWPRALTSALITANYIGVGLSVPNCTLDYCELYCVVDKIFVAVWNARGSFCV